MNQNELEVRLQATEILLQALMRTLFAAEPSQSASVADAVRRIPEEMPLFPKLRTEAIEIALERVAALRTPTPAG